MKRFIIFITLLTVIALPAMAQNPDKKYAVVGLGLTSDTQPSVLGWGALAIPVADRTVSWTMYDVGLEPATAPDQPFFDPSRLKYKTRTGLAFKLYDLPFKHISVWGLGDAGISANGDTVVGSFGGGGFIDIPFGHGVGFTGLFQAERDAQNGPVFSPRFGFRMEF